MGKIRMTHIDKRLDSTRENIAAGTIKDILEQSYSKCDLSFQSPVSWEDVCMRSVDSSNREKELQVHIPWQCTLALLRKNMLHSASQNIRSRLHCFYRMFTPQGLSFILFGFKSPLFFAVSLTPSVLTPCITNSKMGFHQQVHGYFNELQGPQLINA